MIQIYVRYSNWINLFNFSGQQDKKQVQKDKDWTVKQSRASVQQYPVKIIFSRIIRSGSILFRDPVGATSGIFPSLFFKTIRDRTTNKSVHILMPQKIVQGVETFPICSCQSLCCQRRTKACMRKKK